MPRFTNCPINFNEYFWHEPREKLKEVRKPSLTIKGITNAWSKSSRSSRPELFCKKGVPRHATLLKKSLWHRCFPVNFQKFLRTPFLQNTSGRLLLNDNIKRYSKKWMLSLMMCWIVTLKNLVKSIVKCKWNLLLIIGFQTYKWAFRAISYAVL